MKRLCSEKSCEVGEAVRWEKLCTGEAVQQEKLCGGRSCSVGEAVWREKLYSGRSCVEGEAVRWEKPCSRRGVWVLQRDRRQETGWCGWSSSFCVTSSLERHTSKAIQCGNAERGQRGARREVTHKLENATRKTTDSHVSQRCTPQPSPCRASHSDGGQKGAGCHREETI